MKQLIDRVTGKMCRLLALSTVTLAVTVFTGCVNSDTQYPAPPVGILQSGDLIWPKPPGKFIPYKSRLGEATGREAAEWEKEKEQYLNQLRAKPNLTRLEQERLQWLQKMSYADFAAEYFAPVPSGETTPRGLGGFLYVGHVGIISIESGTPFVIEAVSDQEHAVHRILYSKWIDQHKHYKLWLRRLKDRPATGRAAVAEVASSYIGRPYDFWKFNLKDDSGFYCSKLAWLSIYRAVGYADCYGWGDSIDTTGDGWTGNATNTYTTSFGGTSGASPIIAGSAIIVQSWLIKHGQLYSPSTMRSVLSNTSLNTPSADPSTDRIGVMPNLQQIISTRRTRWWWIYYLAWAWLIIIGGLMITPGGVICIACGPGEPGYLGGTVIRVLGVISVAIGLTGLINQVRGQSAGVAR